MITINSERGPFATGRNMLLPEIAYCNDACMYSNMIAIPDLKCCIWEFFPAMQKFWSMINSLSMTGNKIDFVFILSPFIQALINDRCMLNRYPFIEQTNFFKISITPGKDRF